MKTNYSSYLSTLLDEGRVALAGPEAPSEVEIRDADSTLIQFEQRWRLDLPASPPPMSLTSARWAGQVFCRACQFFLFRDIPASLIATDLGGNSPAAPSPSVHYSVDLVFRFLPDLFTMARSASEGDPLVEHVLRWARQWPLSSVGIGGCDEIDSSQLVHDPCLSTMYVDRIIKAADTKRLEDPCVRDVVRRAIGLRGELAPEMVEALQEYDTKHE